MKWFKQKTNQNEMEQIETSSHETIDIIPNEDNDTRLEQLKNFTIGFENILNEHKNVNKEHFVLGELASEITEHMKAISDLAYNTNTAADSLYDKGDTLLCDTREAVEKANNGKLAMDNLISIINVLGEGNKRLNDNIANLVRSFEKIQSMALVIDNIAAQTNLLALNAAIEAARAGEQGKGFAVVAGEVRKLAEITKESTHDISQMIKQIEGETKSVLNNSEKDAEAIARGIDVSMEAIKKVDEGLSSCVSIEVGVGEAIDMIMDQKNEIKSIFERITQVDSTLGIIDGALKTHIDAAEKVDKELEENIRAISSFSK